MRPWIRSLLVALVGLAGLSMSGCGRHESTSSLIVTWSVVAASAPDPSTAAPRRCEELGVTTIRIDVGSTAGPFDFPCSSYAAETYPFASGTYNIQAIAFGGNNQVLTAQELKSFYVYGQTTLGNLRFIIP